MKLEQKLHPKAKKAISAALLNVFESKVSQANIEALNRAAEKVAEAERKLTDAKFELTSLSFSSV